MIFELINPPRDSKLDRSQFRIASRHTPRSAYVRAAQHSRVRYVKGGDATAKPAIGEDAPEINYDLMLYENNFMFEQLSRALDIVYKFIKRKNFILVGGQAIDAALRLKNESLYSKEDVPDYDFYSPDHYRDAIELGNILCKADLGGVSVIVALHATTMRVRVNYTAVADITYCPLVIYNEVPTLTYAGIRIIHPSVQMIDQHSALAYAYDNANFGGTFFRWKKDVDRYNMLVKHYPVSRENCLDVLQTIPRLTTPVKLYISRKIIDGNCLTGYSAFQYYKLPEIVESGTNYLFSGDYPIVSIFTNKYDEICKLCNKKYGNGVKFNAIMGWVPQRTEFPIPNKASKSEGKLIIYNNYGRFLGADSIPGYDIHVCGIQHVLMYTLMHRDIIGYNELIKMANEKKILPTVGYFGVTNEPDSYRLYIDRFDGTNKLQRPRDVFPIPPDCEANGHFDYDTEIFRIDGMKIESEIE